jgi:uncharacterized membrane protein YtjA (UPF0391 family)
VGITRLKAACPLAAVVTELRPHLSEHGLTPHWRKEVRMLHYAVVFFVIAIIAAVLGFSGIAGAASNIAWILFVIFLVLGVISLIRRRT